MPHIPELVVERIATYADTKSLVVLASCNRQWNRYISQLRTWKQRYTQEHPLEDDDELSWLRWYIKTLRASATDTSSDDGDIDWFRAYCHRHACDANWFKNDPKRVKDVKEVTAGSRNRDIVLDRMYRDFSLKEKYVFEYCQPRRAASQQSRYWRRHILRSPDSDSNGYLIECVLTSTFMVVTSVLKTSHVLYIWSASRTLNTKPRRLCYPSCFYQDARDHWLLFITKETHKSDDDQTTATTIHVMNMATERSSKHHVHVDVQHALLQRMTEDTATVLLVTYNEDDGYFAFQWSLWQFSPGQPDSDCRCLMRGEPITWDISFTPTISRLDDNRCMLIMQYIRRSQPELNNGYGNEYKMLDLSA
ncbi:hypothetical protein SYNPS1DRAFT_29961 [Syncephalis pseudoplumigaleata]|uniref:F-box domain-containing protein n=1 Tax=Syncephalis pseudoplumigaleata TaxID=1712513 RepID=A0A4P9YZ14_9FUNG|nr:hypothetical protein SYNPS1DRAFT_29961 [Syncephalis pseudoplumigaleata]|eukprot:RKP24270.1 hypothetical protein SYNPS1DRAFT_29961 [Syncephalis pseudoplumigaleata]